MNRLACFEIERTTHPGFVRARVAMRVAVGIWFVACTAQAQSNAPDHSAPQTAGTARQIAALKRACSIGALSKEECDQKMAALTKPATPPPANHANPFDSPATGTVTSNDPNWTPDRNPRVDGKMYRDNQGRYSVVVPDGWTARPDTDGSGTLQLKHGSAWATIGLSMGTDEGSRPADVAHGILQELKPDYRQPQLLDESDFENHGHAAHGANATGIDRNGDHVAVTVVSIQAHGLYFLSVVSSAPNDQAHEINDQVMQMVKSIRFQGE